MSFSLTTLQKPKESKQVETVKIAGELPGRNRPAQEPAWRSPDTPSSHLMNSSAVSLQAGYPRAAVPCQERESGSSPTAPS